MSEQYIAITPQGIVRFGPAEKAGLSADQVYRMEQILLAARLLKDGAGQQIVFEMDDWIAAQLAAMLFNSEGQAKDISETTDVVFKELQ